MPPRKLTDNQQAQVLEWLCDGKGNTEIVDALADQQLEVTPQAIDYYRDKFEVEIDAAQLKRVARAARRGWGVAARRIDFLCDQLDALEAQRTYTNAAQWVHLGLGKEYREVAAELRKELGQERAAKLELTGKDGGPVEAVVNHGEGLSTSDRLSTVTGLLRDLGLLASGGAGAVEVGTDPAPD